MIDWKNETTWAAIGGGLVAILTGTGILIGSEGATLASVVTNLSAGAIGLITLIRAVSNRVKATKE